MINSKSNGLMFVFVTIIGINKTIFYYISASCRFGTAIELLITWIRLHSISTHMAWSSWERYLSGWPSHCSYGSLRRSTNPQTACLAWRFASSFCEWSGYLTLICGWEPTFPAGTGCRCNFRWHLAPWFIFMCLKLLGRNINLVGRTFCISARYCWSWAPWYG